MLRQLARAERHGEGKLWRGPGISEEHRPGLNPPNTTTTQETVTGCTPGGASTTTDYDDGGGEAPPHISKAVTAVFALVAKVSVRANGTDTMGHEHQTKREQRPPLSPGATVSGPAVTKVLAPGTPTRVPAASPGYLLEGLELTDTDQTRDDGRTMIAPVATDMLDACTTDNREAGSNNNRNLTTSKEWCGEVVTGSRGSSGTNGGTGGSSPGLHDSHFPNHTAPETHQATAASVHTGSKPKDTVGSAQTEEPQAATNPAAAEFDWDNSTDDEVLASLCNE